MITRFFHRFRANSLSAKAILNSLALGGDYAARLVIQLFLTPFLTGTLGSTLYGVWVLVLQVGGYFSSGGANQMLQWSVANDHASSDYEQKRQMVGRALLTWFLYLPIWLCVGGTILFYLPSLLDEIPPEYVTTARITLALIMCNYLLHSFALLAQAVLTGENKGYKRAGLSITIILSGGLLMALALKMGYGLIGIGTAMAVNTFFFGVTLWLIVKKYVPWFGVARPKAHTLRPFIRTSGLYLISSLVYSLWGSGDILLLGILESPATVTPYQLTRFAPMFVIGVVSMAVTGIFPGIGQLLGEKQFGRVDNLRKELMLFSWALMLTITIPLLIWNHSFVELWQASADPAKVPLKYAGTSVMVLIIIMNLQFILIRNDSILIEVTLNMKQQVIIGICCLLLSFGLGTLFVTQFDMKMTGVVLGYVIGQAVLSLAYPYMVASYLNVSFWGHLQRTIRPLLFTLLLGGVATYLSSILFVESWILFIFYGGLTAIITALIIYFIGLTQVQRKAFAKRLPFLQRFS